MISKWYLMNNCDVKITGPRFANAGRGAQYPWWWWQGLGRAVPRDPKKQIRIPGGRIAARAVTAHLLLRTRLLSLVIPLLPLPAPPQPYPLPRWRALPLTPSGMPYYYLLLWKGLSSGNFLSSSKPFPIPCPDPFKLRILSTVVLYIFLALSATCRASHLFVILTLCSVDTREAS
jgi:hypothetical protein